MMTVVAGIKESLGTKTKFVKSGRHWLRINHVIMMNLVLTEARRS